MIRAAFILILALVVACPADEPVRVIQTAEQAVLRFREARVTQLKTVARIEHVIGISAAGHLTVKPMQPRDYQPPYRDLLVSDEADLRVFGTLAAAADSKNGTWRLFFDPGRTPGMVVYLDAVTGKVLYIHFVPEG